MLCKPSLVNRHAACMVQAVLLLQDCMHGAGVVDMQQMLSDDPDSMLCWSLDTANKQVVLKLCGSRYQMKAGIVTAVAEGGNG